MWILICGSDIFLVTSLPYYVVVPWPCLTDMAAQEEETGAKAEGEAGVKAEGEAGAKAEWEVGEATVEVEGKEVDKVEVKSAGGLVSKPDVQAVVVNSEIEDKLSDEFQSNNVDEGKALKNVDDQVPKVEDVEVTMEEEAATSVRELLDSLEARVEGVRRAAAALQGEQEELLSSLRAVGAGVGELGEVEREEVGLEVERLVSRVEAVQVRVATVRTAGQQEAVEKVEMEVRGLVARLQGGGEVELLVRECRGMLAACGGEEGGVRSEGFERLVLGCSASDQKLVRRRLEVLLEQMVALQGV